MLSVALDVTQSGLTSSSDEASVLARNVANAGRALASRKQVRTVALPGGGVMTASITRVSNEALSRGLQTAISAWGGQNAVVDALERLESTVNDPELDSSPAAMAQKLKDSLGVLASSPDKTTLFTSAVDAGKRLATSLNDASAAIQSVRQQADADMASSVESINKLLQQFDDLNRQVVNGTRTGADITDQLDARDDILRSLAEEIGIKTLARSDNDIAIFTDGGSTLFDKVARNVTMQRSYALAPGLSGNAVYIDGVAVTGSGALMSVQNGKLAGFAKVRDDIAVTYQRQMDEVARGLIEAFAESDQSGSGLPDIPGLFTYTGATGVPPSGGIVDGLAGAIRLNPNVDPTAGGDFHLLRDGSIGDPGNAAYTYNTTGDSGYTARLFQLIDGLGASRGFDGAANLETSASVTEYAASSSGWLEDQRQKAMSDADFRTTLVDRSRDALSRATGVNLDEEMSALLDVERSYQTSSKMLTTIDNMFKALLNAV